MELSHHAKSDSQARLSVQLIFASFLSVPFTFSSKGDGFVFRDATLGSGTLETSFGLNEFPTPAELWDRYCAWKGWKPDVRQLIEQAYPPFTYVGSWPSAPIPTHAT